MPQSVLVSWAVMGESFRTGGARSSWEKVKTSGVRHRQSARAGVRADGRMLEAVDGCAVPLQGTLQTV